MNNIIQMKSITKTLNDRTYTDYYYRLMMLALSVFEWEKLPNGIDERWIEKYLFLEGQCMFYKNDLLGFMVVKCVGEGLNEYDEPTYLRPVATNLMDSNTYKNGVECVMIKNNDISYPTCATTEMYALKLAEISRAIDININAQKTPILIKCSNKQLLTLKNVYRQWDGNEPVIFADKSLDIDNLDILNTSAPVVFDRLQLQKHQTLNEYLTFLGINNANMDKKERLVASEVDANNDHVESSLNAMLKSRELACKRINEIFGTNISVKVKTSLKANIEGLNDIDEGGVA